MKFIDGKGVVLGRLATHVSKQLLMGEEVRIFNCDQIIITGNKKTTEKEFFEKRSRVGHSQKGPKHHSTTEKIVKRAIRGMLPNFREGRGKEAFKRLRCYATVPHEFSDVKAEKIETGKKIKFAEVKNFTKKN
jgi:ribosomal protein uL13